MVNVLSLAGPGLKHDIQRALNVRNLNPKTALTKEQADYIDHQGLVRAQASPARHGHAGYRSGDDHSHRHRYLSMAAERASARKAMCKAYNDWAYEYCQENPERLYFAALLPMQDPEIRRAGSCIAWRTRDAASAWSVRSMRWATIRFSPSTSACGTRWKRPAWFTGCIRFRLSESLKPPGYTEQYSGAELIALTAYARRACRIRS